jgi:hypothetical protein
MDDVVKSYPLGELHVVLDNLNIHKNEAAQQWLLRHPRVHFHYTPTHASWMNMIECFFSILTRQALTQSVQRSKKELKDFLLLYLKKYRQNPTPFTWTKGPEHSNASSKQRNRTRLLIPSKQSNGRPKKNTINN